MSTQRLVLLGAAALSLAAVGVTAAARLSQAAPAAERQGAGAATQALADATVAGGQVAGLVLATGRGDEPTRFATAGAVSFDPHAARADADTLWRVYSMTKPVTATAAMILIDDGKLKLDEPLSTYLPAFRSMRVLVDPAKGLESRPATRPITIRNLLTHTAGFAYFTPVPAGPLERDYVEKGIVPLTISRAFEDRTRPVRAPTLEEFARRLAAEPLLYEPGTQWHYSVSLDLVGRVVEVVSGMSFDRFVQTRIFDPLGMRSSFWTVPGSQVGRFATNYTDAAHSHVPLDPAATSLWLSPPSFPYGGAGLVTSARDYDVFLHMLQDGGIVRGKRILRRETAALMMSNLLPPGVTFGGVNGTGRAAAPGGPTGFGAGGSVYVTAGEGGYPGAGTYGWGGAAGSVAWVDPAHRTRGLMMVNVMGGIPGLREAAQKAWIEDTRTPQ